MSWQDWWRQLGFMYKPRMWKTDTSENSPWLPNPEEFLDLMTTPVLPPIRLDRFGRGIDNTHIDVALSEDFVTRTITLVRRLLGHEVAKSHGGYQAAPERQDYEGFAKSYAVMSEVALDRAHASSRPETIQLFQFAVWRFLMETVHREIEHLREELQVNSARERQQSSGNSLQLHERRVVLAKERQLLALRIHQTLFRHLEKVEGGELRRLRKSIIGISWPVPREILFNPLLLVTNPEAYDSLFENYPMLLIDNVGGRGFTHCNRLVLEHLPHFLPPWVAVGRLARAEETEPTTATASSSPFRADSGGPHACVEIDRFLNGSISQVELRGPKLSWLDEPENMNLLLQFGRLPKLGGETTESSRSKPLSPEKWLAYQKHLLTELETAFRKEELWRPMLASYALPRLPREVVGKLSMRDAFRYLAGLLSDRRLRQRVQGLGSRTESISSLRALKAEYRKILRTDRTTQHELLIQFLRDFCRFRRDAKYAYLAHKAMDRIRILAEADEINLSRTNGRLQEFVPQLESGQERRKIADHVVIKADVRGSSAITNQLLERNLNPAAHFSRNFFDPINRLIEEFGATKTFLEGDAVILTLFSYEDLSYQWLSVAHACGLARRIIEVIDWQNAQNRRYGLPDLEVGIGIAFTDGPPTFLYDGERPIMISPAINRADRLSSCSKRLRRSSLSTLTQGHGIEVVAPANDLQEFGDSGEGLIRYNVNGIELDAPAFFKLRKELVLRRVDLGPNGADEEPRRYFAGRYPDRKGRAHWVVIREAPIRIWVGNDFSTLEHRGRCFYEVVTDPGVIGMVREQLFPTIPQNPTPELNGRPQLNMVGRSAPN